MHCRRDLIMMIKAKIVLQISRIIIIIIYTYLSRSNLPEMNEISVVNERCFHFEK